MSYESEFAPQNPYDVGYRDGLAKARADMEARIRALVDEWDATLNTQVKIMTTAQANAYRSCVAQLRALLDAAPAGGAE